jgi:hypothetical protein
MFFSQNFKTLAISFEDEVFKLKKSKVVLTKFLKIKPNYYYF